MYRVREVLFENDETYRLQRYREVDGVGDWEDMANFYSNKALAYAVSENLNFQTAIATVAGLSPPWLK